MSPPVKFAAAVFPGFQALDLFGPLDTLNIISKQDHPMSLYILSSTLDPVSTLHPEDSEEDPSAAAPPSKSKGLPFPMSQAIVPTHTFADCPDDVEVLIVPGGRGCHDPARIAHVADFVRRRMPRLRFLLTVCTGGGIAAQAGVLDGLRATCNKRALDWIIPRYPSVNWAKSARWVVDGNNEEKNNIYTASGISAGMDMMFAFVADQYGAELADRIARQAEYTRSVNPEDDPFARE
ncbi:class I glutamine amidotransferase-like protein [Microdochium trichocladiopsis]|uniref:Class I glutamine amidotransferase-like protein n=1 Tax=Microdochium trichocladiopsis TaxID=1682393 RepID=A0A9P8YDI5_9PEZI|nr:class I glutamine amidotransferase-like protein [Microdochium trichocladiopsis]KAH7037249.1 class I glutamine amidotransferase-like protein [Microdochium trichocladiopsis]